MTSAVDLVNSMFPDLDLEDGRKEISESICAWLKLLDDDVTNYDAMKICGLLLVKLGQFSDAIILLQTSNELSPVMNLAIVMSYCYAMEGQLEEAEDSLPNISSNTLRSNPWFHFTCGVLHELQCTFDEAMENFHMALEVSNSSDQSATKVHVHYAIGRIHARTCNFESALEYYKKVFDNSPADHGISLTELHSNVGDISLLSGHSLLAKHHFQEVLKSDSSHVNALRKLAWIEGKEEGTESRATEKILKALETSEEAETYEILGHMHLRKGHLKLAERAFREGVLQNPGCDTLLCSLGITLFRQYRFHEAIVEYLHAIQIYPQNAEAWYMVGIVNSLCGRPKSAAEAFHKSIIFVSDNMQLIARVAMFGHTILEMNENDNDSGMS